MAGFAEDRDRHGRRAPAGDQRRRGADLQGALPLWTDPTVNTAGDPLTVRSGPGTGYAAVGSVADGQTVLILCQTSGMVVTGTYGTSAIWDRIGTGRYVSDAYVYTGYDGYVPGVPRC